MNQTPELIFRKTISETAKQSEYIFLFRKLAFPEIMYFLENILQEPNAPLVRVRVAFLRDCPLILSLLKHRGVGAFLN